MNAFRLFAKGGLGAALGAAACVLVTVNPAPASAKGAPTPVLQPLRPGECRWGKDPVRRMDGTWTNPNRCYGDPDGSTPARMPRHHGRHRCQSTARHRIEQN